MRSSFDGELVEAVKSILETTPPKSSPNLTTGGVYLVGGAMTAVLPICLRRRSGYRFKSHLIP